MDKTIAILGLVTLALVAVTAGMVMTSTPISETPMSVPPAPGNSVIPHDPTTSALELAKQFVMDDTTFKFDGMLDTLTAKLNESSDPVVATVEFTSRHAGYGDRTGMMLAEVLTPHTCVIKISGGQVVAATMDGTRDMMSPS